jgi:hypothetical protein
MFSSCISHDRTINTKQAHTFPCFLTAPNSVLTKIRFQRHLNAISTRQYHALQINIKIPFEVFKNQKSKSHIRKLIDLIFCVQAVLVGTATCTAKAMA